MMSYPPALPNNPSSLTSLPSNASHNSLASSSSYSVDEFAGGNRKTSADLSYLSLGGGEGGGAVQNGIYRSVSPTVKSDPGSGLLVMKPAVTGESPASSTGKRSPLLGNKSFSLQIGGGGGEGEGFGDVGSQDSDKDASDSSSSKASEEVVSRVSTDSSPVTHPIKKLERRYTETFTSSSRRSLSVRGSGFYPNQVVSPTASIGSIAGGGGSRGSVKQRANPSASSGTLRQRRATVSTTVPLRVKGRMKKVKILLAGDDTCLSNTAKAYAHLRTKEPNLFNNLDIEFFYIPLSKAVIGGSGDQGGSSSWSSSGSLDLPEPACEQGGDENGQDVMIGHYMSHVDSWYEQNVMLAVHNSLRLLMNVSYFYNL